MAGKKTVEVEADSERFEAELADTLLEKSWGLSMRKKGKMLFVFSSPGRPPIDMMLVQEPLNLYFLDSNRKVVDARKAEPWTLDPRTWKVYRPEQDAKFLLESFEDLGLEENEKVEFDL
ncbi:MAG: DUF192 domain-containing protein [Candidatus Nanosalina sp.]